MIDETYFTDWQSDWSTYALTRLLNGESVSFMSSGLPHVLEFDPGRNVFTVSTTHSSMRIPPVVAVLIADVVREKQGDHV